MYVRKPYSCSTKRHLKSAGTRHNAWVLLKDFDYGLSVPSVADLDHIDADPDPTFQFDPDPDPTTTHTYIPRFELSNASNWPLRLPPFQFDGIRIRIQLTKKIKIRNTVCPFGGFFHPIKVRQPKRRRDSIQAVLPGIRF